MTNEQIDRGIEKCKENRGNMQPQLHYDMIWQCIEAVLESMKEPELSEETRASIGRGMKQAQRGDVTPLDTDPILEVYEKYNCWSQRTFVDEMNEDMWKAIKRYAEEKR